MTRARLLLASLAVLALGATACGATDGAETDDAAAAPPAAGACLAGAEDCQDTGGGEDPGQPTQVEPTDGLENVHPVGWEQVQVDPDDQARVTVSWWSGVAPCNALSEVEVEYTEEAVTLTVLEGNVPSDEEQACIEIAQYKSTTVTLDEELGPRSILDGAEA